MARFGVGRTLGYRRLRARRARSPHAHAPYPGPVELSCGDGHGGAIGRLAEHVGEREHDAVVLRSGARRDTEIALPVQAALVGAVADVDAVAREQLGSDGRRGTVQL